MDSRWQLQVDKRSRVFILRLWQEQLTGDQWEWRGRVQDVVSGEVRYFREWGALTALLQTLLAEWEYINHE